MAIGTGRRRPEIRANQGGLVRIRAAITEGWPSAPQLETSYAGCVAERGGFEPPVRFHVRRISSAVHSTTLPPLRRPKVPNGAERAASLIKGCDGRKP